MIKDSLDRQKTPGAQYPTPSASIITDELWCEVLDKIAFMRCTAFATFTAYSICTATKFPAAQNFVYKMNTAAVPEADRVLYHFRFLS